MRVVLTLIGALVANLFKSPHRLEVENLFLRHQLSIALRRAPHRVHLRGCDRALLVWLTWFWQACSVCPAWFSRRRSCGGIALGFGPIGAGNPAVNQAGRKSAVSCANSFAG